MKERWKTREVQVGPVKGKGTDIKATCNETTLSAAGLDQWSTQDFAILNDEAYEWLANMFNRIEAGAP